MFGRLLTAGLLAGAVAGIVAALLQFTFVIPLLLEGELFETGQRIHFSASGSPQSLRGTPGIGGDWGRHLLTVGFDLVTFVGFGLLLVALMSLAEMRGLTKVTPRQGLIWGLAGFVAVQLAPALGLPPELPGTVGAEIGPRQTWWSLTILASAIGLWTIAFGRSFWPLVGVVLLLVPHLVGAPQTDTFWGIAPPELAAEFATISLGTAAAGWTVLGFFCAWFWTRES